MSRGLELLEYWRRVAEKQNKNTHPRSEQLQEVEDELPHAPLTEGTAESQFNTLRTLMTAGGGAYAEPSKIPENLREAIRWAESEKEKRGMS